MIKDNKDLSSVVLKTAKQVLCNNRRVTDGNFFLAQIMFFSLKRENKKIHILLCGK
jgi:hypothetical protein